MSESNIKVIAIDLGSRGNENQLDEFLAEVPGAATHVWRVNPLQHTWRTGANLLDDNAAAAAATIRHIVDGHTVVLGYCAGAAFTLRLAAALEATHRAPGAVVLAGPTPVTGSLINDEIDDLARRLGGGGGLAGELAGLLPGDAIDPVALFTPLSDRLRALAAAQAADLGVPASALPGVVDGIVGWYVDWVCFLFAARSATADARVSVSVHVVGEVTSEASAWIHSTLTNTSIADPGETAASAVARIVGDVSATQNADTIGR